MEVGWGLARSGPTGVTAPLEAVLHKYHKAKMKIEADEAGVEHGCGPELLHN